MATRPTPDLGLLFDVLRADERVGAFLRSVLGPTGLTPMGYAVTSLASELGTTTPRELADMMGSRPSTLTAHLRTLVDAGLLSRTRGRDGRSVDLALTDAGRAVHDDASRRVADAWGRVRRELDVDEARRVVARVSAALEAATPSDGAQQA